MWTGTARERVAQAYLEYLYTPEGQEIAARNFYRPRLESVADKYAAQFPKLKFFGIDQFGGWQKRSARPISPTAAIFDQIYQPGRPVARAINAR